MTVELAVKYSPKVDELFKAESKKELVTNTDYDWTGAHTVKVYKVGTVALNDYGRTGSDGISRFGTLMDLNTTTEEMVLSNDKSFIFNIDKLDQDETGEALEATQALAREIREVVIPAVDKLVFNKMVSGAGTTETGTISDIYEEILKASETLDTNEVPDTERVLIVSPTTYKLIKSSTSCLMASDVSEQIRLNGVVGIIDGCAVIKVPANRLPEGVDFIMAHPGATTAPVKLEDYNIHVDTPLSSGSIVTGRVCYDAFVLDNKAKGIYVHKSNS